MTRSEPDSTVDLLADRGRTHGDFSTQAALSQELKTIMAESPNWEQLSAPRREALEAITVKIGRILAGDPDHADHWADIAGYATLGADMLRE